MVIIVRFLAPSTVHDVLSIFQSCQMGEPALSTTKNSRHLPSLRNSGHLIQICSLVYAYVYKSLKYICILYTFSPVLFSFTYTVCERQLTIYRSERTPRSQISASVFIFCSDRLYLHLKRF